VASKNLTDTQRMLQRSMDTASELAVAYAAPEVPPMGNLTKFSLLEDFGRLNEARKALEKTEKIVRSRLEAQLEGAKELRGDNFTYKKATSPRTALDQGIAKTVLEEVGRLEECMATTAVERVNVTRN
jgi:hypothetical protein